MSRHNRDRRLPKYASAIIAALADVPIRPGQVYTVDVLHDPWCALVAGKGPCNCSPEVRKPKRVVSPEEN